MTVIALGIGVFSGGIGRPPVGFPAITTYPVISGTATVGSTLTCTPGTYTGVPAPTITRQWNRNGVNIAGATALTYVLTSLDAGAAIKCRETATNTAGSIVADSNAITVATTTQAQLPLATENAGISVSMIDGSIAVKQSGNLTYNGPITGLPMQITGVLTPSVDGSFFDSTNYMNILFSDMSVDPAPYIATSTLFSEYRVDTINATTHLSFEFNNSADTANNREDLIATTTSDLGAILSVSAGVNQVNLVPPAWTNVLGTWYKMAFALSLNNSIGCRDAVLSAQVTVCDPPVGLNRLAFGGRGTGSTTSLFGNARSFLILPRRMSDAELQALTT